jgi:hypothetical protein
MMKKANLFVVGWVSMVGLLACQTLPAPETFPMQKALIGMAEEDILTCAGPPLRRVTQGEDTILLYVQHAGALDRTFAGSKGSVSDIQHGCEANITVQAGKVTNVQYHPFPDGSGAYHHCEAIVSNCLP